jgi:hypothetical protein
MSQEVKPMAKKNLLGGFKFEKLPEITNGLIIPTGNDTRPKEAPPTASPIQEPVRQTPRPTTTRQPQTHNFKKLEVDSKAFTPMTNVVPTIENNSVPVNEAVVVLSSEPKFKGLSRRKRQRITPEDLNLEEFGALKNKQERITYLALRGWSLKVEARGNGFYHYATRYVNRKKKRLYLGSVIEDT